MIIVEGPDGAGKTTLCNKLAEDFGLEVMDWQTELGISRDDMKVNPTRRYYYALREELEDNDLLAGVIHDRLYFSSLVYGPIQQGNIQMSREDQTLISRVILALACPIILCMPPKDVVLANVHNPDFHQMKGIREQISDIYDAYDQLFRAKDKVYPYVMWYDYTGTRTESNFWNYEELAKRVKHYLDRRTERTFTNGVATTS